MQAPLHLRPEKGPIQGLQEGEGPSRKGVQEGQGVPQGHLDLEEGLQDQVHLQEGVQDFVPNCEEEGVHEEVRQGVQDRACYLHQDQGSVVPQVLPEAELHQVRHHWLGQEPWSQGW